MKRIDFIKTLGVAGMGMGIPGLAHGITEINTPDLPPLLFDREGNPINSVSKWKEERERIKNR